MTSLVIGCLSCLLTAAAPDGSTLTLEQAVRQALERNERAMIADAREDAAAAGVARARSAFFPALTVSGSYTRRPEAVVRDVGGREVTIQSQNALSATGTASLTLLDARAFPAYRAAALERDAAQLEASEAKRALAFEAAQSFVTALTTGEVRDAAERRLELARSSLADAQARRRAGIASANDVTRAELELATAERALTRADGERELARLRLGFVIGAEVSGPLAPPTAILTGAALEDRAALVVQARSERQDLAALRRSAEAARSFALEPVMRVIPSVELFGTVRATNESGFSGREIDRWAGLQLSWTLFDGGEWLAERSQRSALARISELEADLLDRGLGVEVETAVTDLENAHAAVRQAEVAARAARQNADETRELYRQGLTTALAVSDAATRLFEADVALANERYGLGLAYLDLRAAVGLPPVEVQQ